MEQALTAYQHMVVDKYDEYNALFLRLPFHGVPEAGLALPKFTEFCKACLAKKIPPNEIVDQFFSDVANKEKYKQLFLFLQFVERQIVLFDALEDCAFGLTHDIDGPGSINSLPKDIQIGDYKTRTVLTAHPTQFYSGHVLGIIQDLSEAIQKKDIASIEKLLLQMGKTPFLAKEQPSPIDEAYFLTDYLLSVFYPTIKDVSYRLFKLTGRYLDAVQLGFWPGGDRDGNPNVTAEITLEVASFLKARITTCYIQELDELKRHLTFKSTLDILERIQHELLFYPTVSEFIADLSKLRSVIVNEHDGLFVELVDEFIAAVTSFGFHFATLDLRQDSRVHETYIAQYIQGYETLNVEDKIAQLLQALDSKTPKIDEENDCIAAIKTIPVIQKDNGELGMHRYIISNTRSAANVIEILLLCRWAGIDYDNLNLDIVPLFETIDDLVASENIMEQLYQNKTYQKHLAHRNHCQTIMLGFSDGTKDGGYVTANWSIYQAKKRLSLLSKKYNIDVIFFDGRGGPPSRGGGKTHQYYRGQESIIAHKQIQLTIQGQTISSNFGTPLSARYNMEQLFTAGIRSENNDFRFTDEQNIIMDALSNISAEKYQALKDHPQFFHYLTDATPLNYFCELNIASRPPRRGQSETLTLDDLRAIPFVSAWTLMKQNVPGYYGMGTALATLVDQGNEQALKNLYQESLYFKTLIDNAMQSLKKSYFPLTQYLADNVDFSALWQDLFEEAELTKSLLLKITGCKKLLDHDPVTELSIDLREDIVLPLQVIQQAALINMHNEHADATVMKKLILKSMATNINAGRNSV